jgi:hypothetical protein
MKLLASIFSRRRRFEKLYRRLLREARDLQRNGKLPEFAEKMAEAERLGRKLDAIH